MFAVERARRARRLCEQRRAIPRQCATVMNAIRDPTRVLARNTLTHLQVELGATPVTTLRVVAARVRKHSQSVSRVQKEISRARTHSASPSRNLKRGKREQTHDVLGLRHTHARYDQIHRDGCRFATSKAPKKPKRALKKRTEWCYRCACGSIGEAGGFAFASSPKSS